MHIYLRVGLDIVIEETGIEFDLDTVNIHLIEVFFLQILSLL